jgi:hypothetical protein
MLQRVQTLYLLAAALLLVVFLGFVDVWLAVAGDAFGWLGAVVYGLGGATALVAFGAVFLYKERARQARAVMAAQWLDFALVLVLAVVIGVLAFTTDADFTEAGALGYAVLLMPVFAYVALRLAQMGVKRDIDLVRSMDRLR